MFNENPCSGSRNFASGQTDITKLIAAFHNFSTPPKRTCFDYSTILMPLLYLKVYIQRCAVIADFTCLHSHEPFYLRVTSLVGHRYWRCEGLGRLILLSLSRSCCVALLMLWAQNLAYNLKKKKKMLKGVGGCDRWSMLLGRSCSSSHGWLRPGCFKQCPLIRMFLPYQNGSIASVWQRNSPMKPKILRSVLRKYTPTKWLASLAVWNRLQPLSCFRFVWSLVSIIFMYLVTNTRSLKLTHQSTCNAVLESLRCVNGQRDAQFL